MDIGRAFHGFMERACRGGHKQITLRRNTGVSARARRAAGSAGAHTRAAIPLLRAGDLGKRGGRAFERRAPAAGRAESHGEKRAGGKPRGGVRPPVLGCLDVHQR